MSDGTGYVQDLAEQLSSVRIRGSLQRRILAEISDHLAWDPEADLGAPKALAECFADELGTRRARRAAVMSFAALALAGLLFAAAFFTVGPAARWGSMRPASPVLGNLALALSVLAPQLAFVAGSLAALRAYRRRDARVLARDESVVLARRAGLGLLAGLATMAGLALLAVEYHHALAAWWTTLALSAAGVGAVALLGATPVVGSAWRLLPVAGGNAGDIFDDVGALTPTGLRGRPWKFALAVAGIVALAITLVGVAQSDGFDGALRGVLDALACLAGFAVLGPYLGLR
jgi:hypothetical protein